MYPGAAAETGQQRSDGTEFRYNQQIRFCDLHHNMAGYSGTNGNAVWVHDNRFYDNVLGLQTDVVTGAGHPGFPGDSMLIENNRFYSNNFNIYADDSTVKPAFPFPVGTGMWIAGGNRHQVRNNYFYDNWRRGTMLYSVPDQLICGEAADGNQQAGLQPERPEHVVLQLAVRQRHGHEPRGQGRAERHGLLVGPVPGDRRQLLVGQHGSARREDHPVPSCARAARSARTARARTRASEPATRRRPASS